MDRSLLVIACVLGGVGVALGAFGAHGLQHRVPPERLVTFEIGVRYHMYHALALLAVAWLAARWPGSSLVTTAGWLFVAGVVVFSGSLYALTLTGIRALGAITPIGGFAFIAGWTCLAVAAWRGQ
ncbi:MAG: DUF423 domain-containing protein [Acidobacteria bacterium]|nr:DUF423 domain-containing protein [Acidobacteriota bacterium]